MPAGDKQAATLRALLTKEFDRNKELVQELSDAELHDYLHLVGTALVEIADTTFGTGDDATAAVVEWVGKIRSESELAAEAFDPVLCEEVLLFALGKTEGEELTARQIRDTELLLLPLLVDDRGLDENGIDELIAAALALLTDDQN